jgi:chemotaxis protein CheX
MNSRAVEPSTVLPRTDWQRVLGETVTEVFSIMARTDVTVTEAGAAAVEVTAMVGIGGAMRAKLALVCSEAFAVELASRMLGIPPEDPGSQKAACDALGEICNIVAGYFKAKVGLGDECMLSVPTIVSGRNYRVHRREGFDHLQVIARYQQHVLQAGLEIAR